MSTVLDLIRVCMEDKPISSKSIFEEMIAEKVGNFYSALLPVVGKNIGTGYDIDSIIEEAFELGVTGIDSSHFINNRPLGIDKLFDGLDPSEFIDEKPDGNNGTGSPLVGTAE